MATTTDPTIPQDPNRAALQSDLPEPTTEGQAYVPGPVGKGLQSALIQSAFQSFGEAFHGGGYAPPGTAHQENPGMAGFREAGAKVANALEMRWHQAEFGNLRKNQLARFQKDVQSINDENKFLMAELNRGIWHEADGTVTKYNEDIPKDREMIFRLRGQLEADTIMKLGQLQVSLATEAHEKFGANPLVGKLIADMYEHTSTGLMTQFNPKQTIQGEQGIATAMQTTAGTEASRAQAANAKEKEPASLRQAWALGGPESLDEFINGTEAGQRLWGNVREVFHAETVSEFSTNWLKKNKNLTGDKEAAIQKAISDEAGRLEKVAQWKWVNASLGADAAKQFQEVNPGFGPDPAGPIEPAVKGAISPKETKKKAEEWWGIANEVYVDYMKNDPEGLTAEDGIDYIMNVWLPERLSGKGSGEPYDEYINEFLSASSGQKAQEYRNYVTDYVKNKLSKHAGAGEAALTTEQKGTLQRKRNPRSPITTGGLGRTIANLLPGTDVYPDAKPPTLEEE